MKKLSFAVSVIIAAVFCGASIWEGSASVDLSGELPGSGYYVATKSFPRNTVVDIANLESGKSVRAIVADGLDSPGLLAVLSREAADFLGIQSRSIGRVRMTMPQDPVAFSRFTGDGAGGDPDYNPRALIAAAPLWENSQSPAVPAAGTDTVIPAGTSPDFFTPPVRETPELPGPAARASESVPTGDAILPGEGGLIPVDTPDPAENVQWPWDLPMAAPVPAPLPAERPEELPYVSEYAWQPPVASRGDSALSSGRGVEAVVPHAAATGAVAAQVEPAVPAQNTPSRNAIVLVPAESRPPESSAAFPPASEPAPAAAAPRVLTWDDIPEDLFIAGIPEREEPAVQPAEEISRAGPERVPGEEPVPSDVAGVNPFSAPLISTLEKGMYYLQVGAFSKTDLVESALSRIDAAYPRAVQAGGSPEKPLYRVLVGPVNLGESSALLRRFKGDGYQDAFVRQDG
jgi:hypothetical protein